MPLYSVPQCNGMFAACSPAKDRSRMRNEFVADPCSLGAIGVSNFKFVKNKNVVRSWANIRRGVGDLDECSEGWTPQLSFAKPETCW